MMLGRVVGRLWATRQAAGLAGRKLLLVRPETAAGKEADRLIVAVDGLDARARAIACWSRTAAACAI